MQGQVASKENGAASAAPISQEKRELAEAILLYDMKSYDQAINKCKEVLRLNENESYAYFVIGVCLVKKGQIEKAKDAFLDAILHDDKVPDYWQNLGYCQEHTGHIKEARNCYKRAEELR